ncbi:spindle pole body component [Scheffersomyces xylosifermentans]|uniref:spindle pole body component n=1 Tax=Scheffersomyces xylosifermentans TaxID=1304137 RepID=UPI00315CBA25
MALDRNQLIKVYSNRLVKSLVPAEFGEEFIQSVTSDLLHSISATNISGNNYSTSQNDIHQITDRYKTLFLSHGAKSQWVTFQRIIEALAKLKSVEQICNYLVFFDVLRGGDRSQPQSPFTNERFNVPTASSPRRVVSQFSNKSYTSSAGQAQQQQTFDHIQSSPYRDSPSARNWTSDVPLSQLIESYYETLSEESILPYLSYTLLGLDSKLLFFQNNKEIEIPPAVNNSYTGLLFSILECALLYKNLSLSVESKMGKLNSPIKTAYLRVLEHYLNLYVKDINSIFSVQPTSLIGVYNSIFAWIPRLRLFYSLVLELDTLNGFDFLSKVYGITKFGDLKIRELSEAIFFDISKPYYEILENWIVSGELIDNSNEFFIKFDLAKNDFNDIINFLPTRIPPFISKQSSHKIFQIGKSLIFLSKYCKELKWINNYTHKYSKEIFENNHGLQSMTINEIIELINTQYDEIMNYITVILQGPKNELYTHLVNFKKVYFTDNNDFIDTIILKGVGVFDESSTNISSTYLSQVMTESINCSSMQHFKNNNRLDARVLNPSHGNIGWEVFTVEYRIDDLAINYLLEPQMIQYLKMFNFLWRIKHLQYLLNENYVDASNLRKNELRNISQKYRKIHNSWNRSNRRERKIVWVTKAFNSTNLIRSHLVKFLNSLVSFISYDIIEDNFQNGVNKKLFKSSIPGEQDDENSSLSLLNSLNPHFIKSFTRDINNANKVEHNMNQLTIDELIKVHETYLNKIIDFKLLNEQSIGKTTQLSYIAQIYQILQTIFKFISSSSEFHNLIVNYVLILNLEENEEGLEETTISQIDNDLEDIEHTLSAVIDRIYKQIYLEEFKMQVQDFVQDLRTDFELRELSKLF